MVTIPLEKLAFIVAKAREFDAEVEPDGDGDDASNPADDGERAILQDTADNPTLQELRDAIDALNVDERDELLALVWIGRGDYTADEWADAVSEASARNDRRDADYLIGTPLLADYIEEALAAFGLSLDEFEIGHM
jgi:Protein of unknown function (DUF3775)